MSQPPPPPPLPPNPPDDLPFATLVPREPPDSTAVLWSMLWGFLVGSGVSAVVWITAWNLDPGGDLTLWLVFIVPAVKTLAGLILLCNPGWRAFGGGILMSLAMGFLIFFGACVVYIR